MENDNLNPEITEHDKQTPDMETKMTEEVGAAETVEATEAASDANEASGEMIDAPISASLTDVPIAPVKKKTGLIVGAIAAVLVIGAVAGIALMGQSPEMVVTKAVVASFESSQKLTKQIQSEMPVFAKQTELAEGASVTNTEVKLNSIQLPDVSPMVSMMFSGITIGGTTKSDTANATYDNSYSLTMLGKKLGTINLFNSPTVISAGLPEYFANTYYLDVDKMVENGWDSYLFTELVPAKKEDLQQIADAYKGYMKSIGAMNADETEGMMKRLGEICADTLKDLKFDTVKTDGKKLYTVTIPSESVNATMSALIEYIYLESPISSQMGVMMSPEVKAEWSADITNMAAEVVAIMPTSPTVVTLEIKGNDILVADVLCEGTDINGAPVSFSMRLDGPTATTSQYVIKLLGGEGADQVAVDMIIDSTYAGKIMNAAVDMNVQVGDSGAILDMAVGYKMDGNLERDNLDFNVEYTISSPLDGMEVKLDVNSLGDYYLKEGTIVLALDDIGYNITINEPSPASGEPLTINMNFGLNMVTSALTEQLTQPEGVDVLTLNESDLMSIMDEADAATEKLLTLLLGSFTM